jgi:nucleolin
MSFDMSDRDLNNLFREIKNVIDVRVAIDRRTGQPRGFAHADFVKVEDAEKAMESLQGKVVCGRALRLDYSTSTGRAATTGGRSGAERDTPESY